jgi:hypothetical protein
MSSAFRAETRHRPRNPQREAQDCHWLYVAKGRGNSHAPPFVQELNNTRVQELEERDEQRNHSRFYGTL